MWDRFHFIRLKDVRQRRIPCDSPAVEGTNLCQRYTSNPGIIPERHCGIGYSVLVQGGCFRVAAAWLLDNILCINDAPYNYCCGEAADLRVKEGGGGGCLPVVVPMRNIQVLYLQTWVSTSMLQSSTLPNPCNHIPANDRIRLMKRTE